MRLPVSAVVDELLPFAVGHRHPADAEGRHIDDVGGALVVQRVRLGHRVDAEDERAAGHQYRCARHTRPTRRKRGAVVQQRGTRPQIQRLQHRFVVLILVADHQPEVEIGLDVVVGQRVEGVERLVAHRRAERPRIGRRQQRQVHAAGPGVLERVVEAFDVGRQHARPVRIIAAQQPQLFLPSDVGEVP